MSVFVGLVAGCGDNLAPVPDAAAPVVTMETVTSEGGTLTTDDGVIVTIPPGAVDSPTPITVTTTPNPAPDNVGAVSPVYAFGPEGLVFARPITITLPLPTGVTTGSVYWSRLDSTAFDAIGGTVVGATIQAQTVHFSYAVIGDVSTERVVTGVAQETWISAVARRTVPALATGAVVEALVDDGTGHLVARPGTFTSGTFTIPAVPMGTYLLHAHLAADDSDVYLVTDTNTPDLGRSHGGRPVNERQPVTDAVLDLTLHNLEPWHTGDQIELWATEEDEWGFQLETNSGTPVTDATDTTLAINWATSVYNDFTPVRVVAGDHVTVAQVSSAMTASNAQYIAITRLATLPSTFDLPATGHTAADLTLGANAATASISIDFRGAEFAQMLHQYGSPSGIACSYCLGFAGVLGQPGLLQDGFYSANADLLYVIDPSPTGSDFASGTLNYASAATLDGTWADIAAARWNMVINEQLPGTAGCDLSAQIDDYVMWTTTAAQLGAAPITPKLSAPRNATVNGIAFADGGPSVGATPTIAWQAPALGVPQFYTILVRELSVRSSDNSTVGKIVATVNTPELAFTFPPGALDPAKPYAFQLIAVTSTANNAAAVAAVANSPFRTTIDYADASTTSGIFTN